MKKMTMLSALAFGRRGWRSLTAKAGALRERSVSSGFSLRMTGRTITLVVRGGEADGEAPLSGVWTIRRSAAMAVVQSGQTLRFTTQGGATTEVRFPSEAVAGAALGRIGRRQLSNRTAVWAGRCLAFGLAWLLVSSYLQVKREQAAQNAPSGQATGSGLVQLPDVEGPLVQLPGAASGSALLPAASVGPQQVPPVSAPPSPPIEPAAPAAMTPARDGLAGFGLDTAGLNHAAGASSPEAGGAPEVAAAAGTGGASCDPALAFKAPAR